MGLHEKQISLEYVTGMLEQLVRVALDQNDLFLAYLIGMALAEAKLRQTDSK